MSKKIVFKLSPQSIQNSIDELEKYKDTFLNKNEIFVQRLCEVGIPVVRENISSSTGDSDKNYNTYIQVNSYQGYSEAKLIVEGRELLFIEFGAGIHYNGSAGSSPHPKGNEFGYTIGSYGKGLGKKDHWYYTADTGENIKSFGTKATMPVYKASQTMIQQIRKIAKEVFES